MLNIFNLFLFLLALWLMFMFAAGHVSWLYLFLGFIASAFVAFISERLKLVKKDDELLFLSIGFYRHFAATFFGNLPSSLSLIIFMALGRKATSPTLHKIRLKANSRFNPALLIASFNMSSGLFCVDAKDNEMTIHAIEPSYFKKFNLQKTCLTLRNINEDDII